MLQSRRFEEFSVKVVRVSELKVLIVQHNMSQCFTAVHDVVIDITPALKWPFYITFNCIEVKGLLCVWFRLFWQMFSGMSVCLSQICLNNNISSHHN